MVTVYCQKDNCKYNDCGDCMCDIITINEDGCSAYKVRMRMKVVIDIDEDVFTRLFDNGTIMEDDLSAIAKSIRKGTPFDLEGLKNDMKALNCGYPYGLDYLLDCLNKRLGITITGTDKAESEDK